MLTIMKYWQWILAGLGAIAASYALGYFIGLSDGKALEKGKAAQAVIVEAKKSQTIKEKNDAKTRGLSDDAVNNGLDALGLLRKGD